MNLEIIDEYDQILSLDYPEHGKLRARKVVSRSKARATGKYPSWKMSRMIQWESIHELNAFRLLDATAEITSFKEQPLVIRFRLNKEEHLHYPDIQVSRGGVTELWEIKPAAEAKRPEFLARTRFLETALPQKGFSYRMVIGEDLAREPQLTTALTLLKYGRRPISLLEREQVRRLIAMTGSIKWGTASNGVLGSRHRFILAHLFLNGALSIELDTPLGPDTLFTDTAKKDEQQ